MQIRGNRTRNHNPDGKTTSTTHIDNMEPYKKSQSRSRKKNPTSDTIHRNKREPYNKSQPEREKSHE